MLCSESLSRIDKKMFLHAVLLLYHHPFSANAPTIMEHINAFRLYSSFKVVLFNTAEGFPKGLLSCQFDAIVLHYSLFGSYPFRLNRKFIDYISRSECIKVSFFQDEMQYCQDRFRLIDELGINVIYSLLDPGYFQMVYKKNTTVRDVRQTLTGYVSDDLLEVGREFFIPFSERAIDVGYRARKLQYRYGQGAREKSEIADRFLAVADKLDLALDISTKESDRIYGKDWYKFIANCRFMLGVMAGTSIFDLDGGVTAKVEHYMEKFPMATFPEVQNDVLLPYENKIRYRTISPRVFECAALRVCMVLYRDDYQGVLIADEHYIPLEKDFSNIGSVLAKMQDYELVEKITERVYADVIGSGKWHYENFIQSFDQTLKEYGCVNGYSQEKVEHLIRQINRDKCIRYLVVFFKDILNKEFYGRSTLKKLVHSLGYKGRSI